MSPSIAQILSLLALLQIKHLLADYYLQTPMMLRDRARPVHFGRAAHCLVHAAGTALCLLFFGTSWGLLAALVIFDWAAHYAIDLIKGRWSDKTGYSPDEAGYWRGFGTDQFGHQLTYLLLAAMWAAWA